MSEWNPMRQAFEPPTLAAFLLARIAEDERRARSVRKMNNGIDGPTMPPIVWEGGRCYVDHVHGALSDRRRLTDDEYAAMVEQCSTPAEPDPRVLAECEAKRLIVDEHAIETDTWQPGGWCVTCSDDEHLIDAPCRTLRALALPYATHPDFRIEWLPDVGGTYHAPSTPPAEPRVVGHVVAVVEEEHGLRVQWIPTTEEGRRP